MEKRVLVAIVLSILVLVAFKYLAERRMPETPRSRLAPSKPVAPIPSLVPPAEQVPPPALQKAKEPEVTLKLDTKAQDQEVLVDASLYSAVLSNRGAVLTSWKLKRYNSGKGEVFEMIAAGHSPESRPYPGALILNDPTLNGIANGEFYEVKAEHGNKLENKFVPPLNVTLLLRRGSLRVEKRYHFYPDHYLIDFSASVLQDGKPVPARVLLGEDIGPEHEHLLNPAVQLQVISNQAGKIHRQGPPDDESQIKRIDGEMRWVGLDMHYFSVIAIPVAPLSYFELQKKAVKTVGLDAKDVTRNLIRLSVPLNGSAQFQIFLGPKDQEVLVAIKGADLTGVIDFGMFSFLVHPLLYSLKWIERYAHNYGLAIILLTLFLTLLLFPFRLKQMLSMKKMQVIQPKIKDIQDRYRSYKKTDPRRAEMNQEIMALYKEHNVNPLGGCLPLILQMPLLFAFYQLLAAAIELRQAPFAGWIQDLSVKDPYYVLPIIMGVTQLISQKMTPMAPGTDPTQAKMMMMMPAVFTIMFLNLSSGLNLYFLCSNIFQIAFQKLTEPWIGGRKSSKKSRR